MLVLVGYWVHQSFPLLEQSGTVTLCLVPPLSVATASVPFTSTLLTPPSLMFEMRTEYDQGLELWLPWIDCQVNQNTRPSTPPRRRENRRDRGRRPHCDPP